MLKPTFFLRTISMMTASVIGITAHAASLADIQAKNTIRIAVANEIPYGYTDLDGSAKGVGPEVAQHLIRALGIENIEWHTTNFGSLIPGLQADRFDMVAAEMAILPQRCQQVLFSEPNSSYGEGLLVAKDNPKDLHRYEDFIESEHTLAIMAGADQLEIMQQLGMDESRLVTIANNADAISTVATGRADAYAATGLTAAQLAQQSPKVEVAAEFVDPVVNGQPVRSWGGFTFAQNNTELRDAINTELAKFKQTQAWQDILSRYGFSETDQKESNAQQTADLCGAKTN